MSSKKTFNYGVARLELEHHPNLCAIKIDATSSHHLLDNLQKTIGNYNIYPTNITNSIISTRPVYNIKNEKTLVVPTGDFYVEFKPGTSQEAIDIILNQYQLNKTEEVFPKAFLVKSSTKEVLELTNVLQNDVPQIQVAEPDLVADTAQYEFQVPTDELLTRQWYLENNGIDPSGKGQDWKYRKGADAKVVEAWQILHEHKGFISSPDITIAVLDKGFDLSHPDFEGKIIAPRDFNYENSTLIPEPFAVQKGEVDSTGKTSTEADHGTSCAGIALAAANGSGVVGVAPNSKFMPIRYYVANGRFMRAMFRHMTANGADVASCSFGNIGLPMDRLSIRVLRDAATRGRNGRGMVIVFATGNAYDILKNNELATHPDIIAVGATTSEDTFAPYTNRTNNMSVVAPGGYGHSGTMTTADVGFLDNLSPTGELVEAGKGEADDPYYRHNAEGTSFATPLVAGVAALVLSANPNLTASEVKSIMETTADKVGDAGEYDESGHSPKFGFGRVNAANAVRKALNLPLKEYKTEPGFMGDIQPFSFDYGQTINGTHDANSEEVVVKITVDATNAGRDMLAEIEVGLDHNPDNEFELYVQKGKKPIYFPDDYIDKKLGERPSLVVAQVEQGDYYFMLRCINKKSWDYVKGGGDFELTITYGDGNFA